MKKILSGLLILALSSCAINTRFPMIKSMEELSYISETKKIEIPTNNITLAYTEQGSGDQTLLFIHGLGSYLPAWNNNIPELAKDYHCIAIDLPGYGKSSKGNYEYTMTFFAQVIKEFCEAKDLDNVVLVGHSMGGQIALTTALQFPALVDKLVLVAPAGFETFNKGQRDWLGKSLTQDAVKFTSAEQIRTNLGYNFYNLPADAEFMITDRIAMRSASDFDAYCYAVSKSVSGMVDQPIFTFLPEIKHPILTLFGANDNLIPNRYLNGGKTEKYAKEGNNQLPNGKLVMIEKTGHFAQFESYERVNQEIKAFLK